MPGQASHLKKAALVSVIGCVVALLLILPIVLSSFPGTFYHQACTSSQLSVQVFWTPVIIVNSPLYGNASGTARFEGPWDSYLFSTSTNSSNGSVVGLFSLDSWALLRQTTGDVIGPGANQPCSQPYTASDLTRHGAWFLGGASMATNVIAPPGTSSDTDLKNQVVIENATIQGQGASFPSVIFDADFSQAAERISTCGNQIGAGLGGVTSSTSTGFVIPFILGGADVSVEAQLPVAASFSYTIAASAQGSWGIDTTADQGPAFEYAICPSNGIHPGVV